MDDHHFLQLMRKEAFERLEAVEYDPLRLDKPWRTVVLVEAAQGVIENGGLAYFFANDWPHATPYEEFAAAYERIGKTAAAQALRSAVATMQLEDAEVDRDARVAFIEQNRIEPASSQIRGWNEAPMLEDPDIMLALIVWLRSLAPKKAT